MTTPMLRIPSGCCGRALNGHPAGLNFLDTVVRTSKRARIRLGRRSQRQTHLAMNLLLLLALAVPLSCLALLSLLALLGVMTLGAVIHGTVRARWPQWRGVEQANNPAG